MASAGEACPPLQHRSSIAPSPLPGEGPPLMRRPSADAVAGNGWDGGRGRDRRVSHTSPHPHPCPPPSRGRESARTGSSVDYLTDVLEVVLSVVTPAYVVCPHR